MARPGPNQIRSGYRLLLSATVQSSSTTTPSPPSPTLTNISQSHRRWRAGSKLATFAAVKKPPVGTTFRFTLNTAATVSFAFSQLLPGRKVNGKCVAQTAGNRTRRVCQRSSPQGSLSFFSSSAGPHRLSFQGRVVPNKKLGPGTYTVTITATNAVGGRVARTLRSFTIVPS